LLFATVMSRKKEEGGGIPEWMCTFGDMMSLLLCFFIMLYSMSIITPRRWDAIADTLKQDFGFAGSSQSRSRNTKTTTTISDSAAKSRRTNVQLGGQPIPATQGDSLRVHELQRSGETVRGGVILFESGNDDLTEQAKRNLRELLPILQGSDHKIVVKGRAAPAEEGGKYEQRIDMAYARAVNVTNYFVSQGLKGEFFEIVFETGSVPNATFLPAGTDASQAAASVEIILLDQTQRQLDSSIGERVSDTPVP
jgi:chemotaxis protein MotB